MLLAFILTLIALILVFFPFPSISLVLLALCAFNSVQALFNAPFIFKLPIFLRLLFEPLTFKAHILTSIQSLFTI